MFNVLADGERDMIRYYLGKKIEPTDEFWAKANERGLVKTVYAIRKAGQEDKKTIEHITSLIGNVVKEGNVFMYRSGFKKNDLKGE